MYRFLIIGLLAVTGPASLYAQSRISVAVAGGVSVPEGDLRNRVKTGWHALGTVALSSLLQPLGLRLDLAYNRFEFSDEQEQALGDDGNETSASATLNLTYRLPMTNSPLSPYLVSGLGAYRGECSLGPGCGTSTRFGWNVGLGTKFYVLGLPGFVEARYHRTGRGAADVHYFPVTFGLTF